MANCNNYSFVHMKKNDFWFSTGKYANWNRIGMFITKKEHKDSVFSVLHKESERSY